MIPRWTRAVTGAFALSLTFGVAAAKPVFSVKTRVFEGRIEIDARLRPYAKLHSFLIGEGKRGLARIRKYAEELGVDDLGTYQNHAWTDDITFTLRSKAGPIISVLRRDLTDMGGAHPNTEVATTIWDQRAERPLALNDLLIESAEGGPTLTALAKLIRDDLAAARRKDGLDVAADPAEDSMLKRIEAKADKLGSPSLAPSTASGKASGLTFHFSPYAVAGFADGIQVAFVPASAVWPLVKPELRPLFGGDRSAQDMQRP